MRKISSTSDKVIIIIVITVSFYIGILVYADINRIDESVIEIDFRFLPIIIGLMGIQILVLAIKFQRLLSKLNIDYSYKKSLKIFVAGMSLIITPGGIGTAIKSHIIKKKDGIPISSTLPVILVERVTELIAILILLTFFTVWFGLIESYFAIIIGFALVIVWLIISSNSRVFESFNSIILKIKFIQKFKFSLKDSQDSLSKLQSKSCFSEAIGWSIIGKTAQFFAAYLIFYSMGIDLSWFVVGQVYYTSLIIGILSFIPAGTIITESTMLALLLNNGIEFSIATVTVIFTRLVTTWLAAGLGIATLKLTNLKSELDT